MGGPGDFVGFVGPCMGLTLDVGPMQGLTGLAGSPGLLAGDPSACA